MKYTCATMLALAIALGGCRDATPAALEIVSAKLTTSKLSYGTDAKVSGSLHNPRETPARGVEVAFELVFIDTGTDDGKPQRLKPLRAWLDYVPARTTVEFDASEFLGTIPAAAVVCKGAVKITESNAAGKQAAEKR